MKVIHFTNDMIQSIKKSTLLNKLMLLSVVQSILESLKQQTVNSNYPPTHHQNLHSNFV